MVWTRYIPGLTASLAGFGFLYRSRGNRGILFATLATLVGLVCMEWEYWVAHGFPSSEISFFIGAATLTGFALMSGRLGGVVLGLLGMFFFAYVNLRYGAPYLLDWVLPVEYAILFCRSRRDLGWVSRRTMPAGWIESVWIGTTYILTMWRTTRLEKWGWITGASW